MAVFDRWLLNTFSTTELVVIVTAIFVVIAVAGFLATHRLLPHFEKGEYNEVTGFVLALVAVLYGILLGFVVIVLYEQFNSARENVETEASALSQVYRDTLNFPPAVQKRIAQQVEDYSREVRTLEWERMKHGKDSEVAWNRVLTLERTLERFQPQTPSDQIYASQAAEKVNDLVAARRTRLSEAQDSLPGVFQILLVGGALLTIFFLYFFGMPSRRAQTALVGATAALIGFSLALTLVLDYPFAGQVSVSNAAFHEGILRTIGP